VNVRPVLPLPIGEQWAVVSRTVVPFLSVPVSTTRQVGGIADIQEEAFFTSTKPTKFTWGVGPVFSFPTATNPVARTGQWGLGPTAVALVMPGPWVIGVLANNVWRIGGEAHGHVLNTFTLQPFINFNLPRAWAISSGPLITSDWSAADDQRWTVPIGLEGSKITHIGVQPMSFEIQYYHNVEHPSLAGSDQMRFQAEFLWPTASAKAAKEKEMAKEKGAKEKESGEKAPAKEK